MRHLAILRCLFCWDGDSRGANLRLDFGFLTVTEKCRTSNNYGPSRFLERSTLPFATVSRRGMGNGVVLNS